ncbi:MAG: PD40 domain-containing protein [Acidobacteria bacterium]|nr:PD40 domain-containing protein [Acidobacteriota bacterium]
MSSEFDNLYQFGEFLFDRAGAHLQRGGEIIPLSPKAAELLALLLENCGRFVSKDEIFERVWPATFVEDGVLTQNIYTLRKTLGSGPDGKPLIENKTRLGYRITAAVVAVEKAGSDAETRRRGNAENHDAGKSEPAEQPETDRPPVAASPRRRVAALLFIIVIPIALAAAGWRFRPQLAAFFRKPIESVKFTGLTKSGDIANAVLSPDGKFAAFIKGNNVFLRDLAIEKEIRLDIPGVDSFSSLQFSNDGNYLYFRNNNVLNTLAKVFRVSRFGGEKELVVERTWGSFSLSPDGKNLAFFRNVVNEGIFRLVLMDLENRREEKEFTALEAPNTMCLNCAPAWSPDGRKIIFAVNTPAGTSRLMLLDLAGETANEISLPKFRRFEQAVWFPDGESFLVSASDGGSFFHLWKVFYPNGDSQPLTNGLVSYGKASISADGKKILAVQSTASSNIFVANADNLNEQKPLTTGNQNGFGQTALNWIDDRRIVFSIVSEKNPTENLAVLNLADNSKTALSNETGESLRFPTSDGKFIYFNATKNGFSNIYRMTTDGTERRAITDGTDGQRQSPRVTNDGRFVYYTFRARNESNIRRFDLETQKEEIVFNNPEVPVGPFMELSPDNKYITFFSLTGRRPNNSEFDKYNAVMTIVALDNPAEYKIFPVSIIPPVRRFSPDGRALDWISAATDGAQLVRQAAGEPGPVPIYTTPDGRIFNFAWSKNGKQLALARGQLLRDAVLLTDFDK